MLKINLIVDKPGVTKSTSRPRARIAIEGTITEENKTLFISPDCLTYGEVDYQLKTIEKNIEQIRKKNSNYIQGYTMTRTF